jgi:hypothetical protein
MAMIHLLLSLVQANLSFLCASDAKTKQFGVFVSSTDSRYAFASGYKNSTDGSFISVTGTGFGKFAEYVDGEDFIFPSDKYPNMFSGSKHLCHVYHIDEKKRVYYVTSSHTRQFFAGLDTNWSSDTKNCPIEVLEIREMYKRIFRSENPSLALKGSKSEYPMSFQVTFNATHLHSSTDGGVLVEVLDKGGADFGFKQVQVEEGLEVIDYGRQIAVPMEEIHTREIHTYSGSFTKNGASGETQIFMRIYVRWFQRKMMKFYVVESFTDALTGCPGIIGTVSTQKFLSGCCNFRRNKFDYFQLEWEDFKYEDHWYTKPWFFYLPGGSKSERRKFKVRDEDDVNEDAKLIEFSYNKEVLGKFCVWKESGIKGQLMSGFQWRSLDGKDHRRQIYLMLLDRKVKSNKLEISVIGCGPLS